MNRLRIGVDVGGTNTDAVAIADRNVLARVKRPTTEDILSGVVDSIGRLLTEVDGEAVEAVMIGTTHFTNAVIEAKHLARVGVVRVAGSATRAIPPMLDWPERLRSAIAADVAYISGGHEFDGREIGAVDSAEVDEVARLFHDSGVTSAAVTSVFSPVRDDHERAVADRIEASVPGVSVSRSAEVGRLGLIERENATILNAALRPLAGRIVDAFDRTLAELGIDAPLYLSQNDGTLMGSGHTRAYPVATFASGPTNSMRGAAFLSSESDCAVVDIGGTTTDIGILRRGFPREASLAVEVGGVRTNFRMPDLVSVGVGGGSLIRTDSKVTVGPDSVGHRLASESRVFGGETLTATDIAVAAGLAEVGDPTLVADLDPGMVREASEAIAAAVADSLDRLKTGPGPIPVVLVGGGAILLGDEIAGASHVHRPDHADVANAIGAGLAQVGAHVDRIVALGETSRQAAIDEVGHEARRRCAAAGADPATVEVVDVEEVPLAYLPSNAVRITMRAVGDLR